MAFTDNCDLYASVHEEGVNRVINHLMLQRPSMFNYATADIAKNREQWCSPVDFTEDVIKYGNPIFTVLPALPVIGPDAPPVQLGFCVQLQKFELDFHPSDIVDLPPEIKPPLDEQRFSMHFTLCGGIGCPDDRYLERIPVERPDPRQDRREPIPPIFLPSPIKCFCLDIFFIGHFETAFILNQESLLAKVDGVELVDITPASLESSIECYLKTALTLTLRQKLAIPLATFFVSFPLFDMGTVTLAPTPNPPVSHNPAIEEDQLKAFVTMTVI